MADKKELLRFCGSLEQAAGVRRIEYQDGRASGLRCALVQNGPLEFLLMLDKCLDPACPGKFPLQYNWQVSWLMIHPPDRLPVLPVARDPSSSITVEAAAGDSHPVSLLKSFRLANCCKFSLSVLSIS